ncbi:MAG: MFS transporter [Betaproteobacteria bacterium]|nr:MFS transporter [Betaproteobacteria bacterium]
MPEKTLALNPSPPAAIPVLAITALALAALASGVSMRLADALLPRLAREFGVSLGQASQVVTVFAVAYGLAQLLFGPLGDRFGKYRVIGWSCAASALTALLCALAHSHDALMAARLLAGASSSAVIPLAMAWIGDVVAYERRQPVLARFLIGQITGFAIGVWAGGYAAEHLDWRTPFYGVAVLFALAAVLLQWVRRGLPASGVAPRAAAPGNLLQRTLAEFSAVLVRPWARVVLVTVFFEGACLYGPFAFIAAHLHQRFDLPLSTVGALVMLFALGSMSYALSARLLVGRLGEVVLVRTGSVFMAAALGVLAFAPTWWWAMPACALLGLGFYMMHNTLQTHATQIAPERRGAALATFAASLFLGQSLGVGAAGLLVGVIGTGWVLSAGGAGMLLVAWNFNRQRSMRPEAGTSLA